MVTRETAYPRLLPLPRRSFFLFGMRGVGKSTWAKQALPDAPRVDLLGLFPTVESMAAQGVLLACVAYAAFVTWRRRHRPQDAGVAMEAASPGGAKL